MRSRQGRNELRQRVYEIIEVSKGYDRLSSIYDVAMMIIIVVSLIPLAFKDQTIWMLIIDRATAGVFIVDYLLRLWTADFKYKKGWSSFVKYPFGPLAIIDLLSILPSIIIVPDALRLLKVFRLLKSLKVVKAFKTFRYSKSVSIIIQVFERQKESLVMVIWFAIGYIIISALLVFNIEPETFDTFFEAIYWATISLTTMGYGDIYPVSDAGRVVTMISSVLGIAIVALPASIITAGYMAVVDEGSNDKGAVEDDIQ